MTDTQLRELDTWIAEHVMGWTFSKVKNEFRFVATSPIGETFVRDFGQMDFLPKFTTDPAAAFAVLDKLASRGEDVGTVKSGGKYLAFRFLDLNPKKQWWVEGDSLTMAICLLAKKLFSQ